MLTKKIMCCGALGMLLVGLGTAVAAPPASADGKKLTLSTKKGYFLKPGQGWYWTRTEISKYLAFVDGTRMTLIYTGRDAPAPTAKTVRHIVLFSTSKQYASVPEANKEMASFSRFLKSKDFREGAVPVSGFLHPCFLAPDKNRTLFLVPMMFGKSGVTAVVVIPKPGAKFPITVLRLLETVEHKPPASE